MKKLPKTPLQEYERLRLGGCHALSFAPQKHIHMICGRPVVVPSSSKEDHEPAAMVVSLPPCADELDRSNHILLMTPSPLPPS